MVFLENENDCAHESSWMSGMQVARSLILISGTSSLNVVDGFAETKGFGLRRKLSRSLQILLFPSGDSCSNDRRPIFSFFW